MAHSCCHENKVFKLYPLTSLTVCPGVCQAVIWCRGAVVMMQYSVMANNYWLLVEGIYLHSLLVITVFSEKKYFYIYLAIGWGKSSNCSKVYQNCSCYRNSQFLHTTFYCCSLPKGNRAKVFVFYTSVYMFVLSVCQLNISQTSGLIQMKHPKINH